MKACECTYSTPRIIAPLNISYSIIPPHTPYAIFTTDHCITTGRYFLSIPNISQTFYGAIHSFIIGTSVDCQNICPAIYFRRIIHYVHTSLVLNNRKGIGNYFLSLVDLRADNQNQQRMMTTTTTSSRLRMSGMTTVT